MKYRPIASIFGFVLLVLFGFFVFHQNLSFWRLLGTHSRKIKSLQENLKDRRKNASIAMLQKKENLGSISLLVKNALSLETLPNFIKGIDQKMALNSLYREDVSYSRRDSAGSFSIVQVSLRLTGGYEEFRRFLCDIENSPEIFWVKSVQALQDKTFLRFFVILHLLVKS